MENVEINAKDIMKQMTIGLKIKGVKVALFRMKMATLLMRLSAFIAGTGIEIEE